MQVSVIGSDQVELSQGLSAIAGLWQARERLLSRHAKPRRGDDHDNYCKENNFH